MRPDPATSDGERSAARRGAGPGHRRTQRGAALLVAMIILTLVSTLAAGMIWQQWRALQVESAERARSQAAWIVTGALDWGRLILREDRTAQVDHLGEVWATPLAEARLSTFLAVDREHNTDSGPEAFLSGSIRDAQSRYNLRNLVVQGKLVEAEVAVLRRLCESAAVSPEMADLIAAGLLRAWADGGGDDSGTPLRPRTVAHLAWLGVDAASVQRLTPFVELLPVATPLNVNTASRDVLAAVIDGLDAGSAERMVQARQRHYFESIAKARAHIPEGSKIDSQHISVSSRYFEISGRLRLEGRVLEERALVERRGREVVQILRERHNLRVEIP
jgi:general secretion pathway protein K